MQLKLDITPDLVAMMAAEIRAGERALLLLDRMKEAAGHCCLFPSSRDRPIADLKRPWAWLRKEAELPDLRIHDLRHSFASVLISDGATLEIIGKLLGHSQHQTTLRYAHLMDDPMRAAANRFSAQVLGPVKA